MPLVWLDDSEATFCALCSGVFNFFKRKHHCRKCGKIYCSSCTPYRMKVPEHGFTSKVRVCTKCCYESMHPPKIPPTRLQLDKSPEEINQIHSTPNNHQTFNNFIKNNNTNSNDNNVSSLSRHQSLRYPSSPSRVSSTYSTSPPSSSFISPSPSHEPCLHSLLSSTYEIPKNWKDLEEIHMGPILSFPIQYGIPSGVKTVELIGGFSLQRSLNGFRLLRPNAPAVSLNIEHTYVSSYTLQDPTLQMTDSDRAIVKTGPAQGMVPGSSNWTRGAVKLDGTQMTWHPKEGGGNVDFLIGPDVVIIPIDRGGQVKGIVSKVDGVLGIAERAKQEPSSNHSPRTIWYFHFPSKDVRNMWHFSLTYNIAHSLSDDVHFQQTKVEFEKKCYEFGVPDVNGLDWKGILDILFSDI